MKTGAVAILDALGFKGIWKRTKSPDDVVRHLRAMADTFKGVVANYHKEMDLNEHLEAEFLSDTIALGLTYANKRHPGEDVAQLSTWVQILMREAASTDAGLAYRGCFAHGEFEISDRFLIGPAIDEAAELHEVADAAVVWCAPSAKIAVDGMVVAQKVPQAELDQFLIACDIPLKGSRGVRSFAVNPLGGVIDNEASAIDHCRHILLTFDREPTRLDVLVKKQNTARLLEVCMKARGWNWKAPL